MLSVCVDRAYVPSIDKIGGFTLPYPIYSPVKNL
jgi:hypothetical protein